jgi:hypothetical protein
MNTKRILVGTAKGLIEFSLKDSQRQTTTVHFKGYPVSMIFVDDTTQIWWVGLSHKHWGEKLHYSLDYGNSWQAAGLPSFKGYTYRAGVAASLRKIWIMQRANQGNGFWLGTEPGGLFFSDDGGQQFQLNEALWNHPSRLDDNQWFGTGKDFPFIHSILVDPRNSQHVYVGVSCAGVFETTDGGITWLPRNTGLIAAYLPNTNPEIGHDPHQMLMCQSNPDVIWQQNHCGIFRTTNGGKDWKPVSQAGHWPHYGFALAIDHQNPDVAWVIPAESDEARVPVNLKLSVCQTHDGGQTWQTTSTGLPTEHAFDLVLRHGFVRQPGLMVFGTTNGNLYYSVDDGEHWQTLSNNLAAVGVVAIA